MQLTSPRADWWWWRGRGCLRQVAASRPRWRARGHPKSSEPRGDGGQCAAVEATQGSREEFGRVGRRRELAVVAAMAGGRRCSHAGGQRGRLFIASARGGKDA
jgi:hypothetical protein